MQRKVTKSHASASIVLCTLMVSSCNSKKHTDDADIALAAISNHPSHTQVVIPAITANKPLQEQVTTDDLHRLEQQAYGGDPLSANLLMQYYAQPATSQAAQVLKWRQIAAENGDSMAAGLVASDLSRKGGEERCLRAKFWEERALRINLERSGEVSPTNISNLEVLASDWDKCVARGSVESDAEHQDQK